MSNETQASFDPMRALRILLKLEETQDSDMSYLRKLLLADAKQHIEAAARQSAPETEAAGA